MIIKTDTKCLVGAVTIHFKIGENGGKGWEMLRNCLPSPVLWSNRNISLQTPLLSLLIFCSPKRTQNNPTGGENNLNMCQSIKELLRVAHIKVSEISYILNFQGIHAVGLPPCKIFAFLSGFVYFKFYSNVEFLSGRNFDLH